MIDRDGMVRAFNFTQAGRFPETTELIQRRLRWSSASGPEPTWVASPLPKAVSATNIERPNPLRRLANALRRSFRRSREMPVPEQSPDLLPEQAPPDQAPPDQAPPDQVPPGSLGAGVLLDKTFTNDSGAMSYKVYVPPGCPGQSASVIVMLHGGTQAALDFAAGTGMNQHADRHRFLVVYPEQDVRANSMRHWNWFSPQNQRAGDGEPTLIAGVTEQVIKDYDADPDRAYVVGLSAGAAMAVVMAAIFSDLYAAAGVHSGLPYGAARDFPSAFALMQGMRSLRRQDAPLTIPLIVFHGDHDQTVNVANAGYIRQQRLGVDEALTAADGVRLEHGQVPDGHAYTRTTYADESGALLEQWIVHGAGHAWSGGTAGCSYTDPRGPDASAEMVRFFSEHGRGR